MKLSLLSLAVSATFALSTAAQAVSPIASITKKWTYNHASVASEIAAYDSLTNTIWVAGVTGVDVLDVGNNGSRVAFIDTSAFGNINSVAIHNGLAAFAIEDSVTRTNPGMVKFFDTTTLALSAGINSVSVGALPDMLTFSKDGSRLLVANEGTPTTYGVLDPVGSVSIIDMASRTVIATPTFGSVVTSGSNLRAKSALPTSTGMDFEPEYIAINAAGTRAFVTLQEANGLGIIDLDSNTAIQVVGLGVKDFSQPGNWIDPNHKDSKIELRAADVKGLYQPDAIVAYEVGGNTYLVMANEGDTREDDGDKLRVKDAGLAGYPADLKELNISTIDTTSGTDLVTFGARSFSIRDANGNLVYDSGNILDAKAIELGIYDDGRSDDKGVEPEGVALMELGGRTLAFVGLERTTSSAVAIFDITDPNGVEYLDMIVGAGDVSPEGLLAFSAGGKHYLGVAHEVSNTTTLYQLTPVPEPESWAMLLAGLGLVGWMVRRRAA